MPAWVLIPKLLCLHICGKSLLYYAIHISEHILKFSTRFRTSIRDTGIEDKPCQLR